VTCADFHFSLHELLDKLVQGRKLLSFNKLKLIDIIDKMFETSVQMRFCRQQHNVLEMGMVNVRVYSEKSFENNFDNIDKVSWEWYS
jgi:hypothetical protein